MGDGGGARTSRATARLGGCGGSWGVGGHVGQEEGLRGGERRGLLAAYLSIVAIFFFFETSWGVHRESTSALKKEKPEH